MKKKIVLAYSGGLDTTTIIPWLIENYDAEVIAACVNVGQEDIDVDIKEKAIKYGASECHVIDAKSEFASDYLSYIIKANAKYESKYMLGTSIARPIITEKLVNLALKNNAYAICHGATGKGNDQIRFELAIKALAPKMEVIAPWRIWDIKSREDAIEYLNNKELEHQFTADNSYSRDGNLWHVSSEGLELENTSYGPKYEKVLTHVNTPMSAPDQAEKISIEFEKGIPSKLNGELMPLDELISELNVIGAKHGIGIEDIVENRVVGMKSRGVYETSGGTIIYYAHKEIESLTLDKEMMSFQQIVSNKFAELVYEGKWHMDVTAAIRSFLNTSQENVNGTVDLILYKGNVMTDGSSSPNSLYVEDLASFATGELYDHKDAEGFINLYGLPLKVSAMIKQSKK